MKFKIIPNEQTPIVPEETSFNDNKRILTKFMSFVYAQKNCAGLAANQVSLNKKRLMIRAFAIKNNIWELIINPEIISYEGKKEKKIERCLTWLGRRISVDRHYRIDVEYFDINNNLIKKSITGFQAQVWQHEYNHLEGIEEKFIEV